MPLDPHQPYCRCEMRNAKYETACVVGNSILQAARPSNPYIELPTMAVINLLIKSFIIVIVVNVIDYIIIIGNGASPVKCL